MALIQLDSLVLCKIFDKKAPLEEEDLDSDCDSADDESGPIPCSNAAQITPRELDNQNMSSILCTTNSSCGHGSILEPSIQECASSVAQLPCAPIDADEYIDGDEFMELEGAEGGDNCKVDSTVPDEGSIGDMHSHEMPLAVGNNSGHLPLNSTEALNFQGHPECVHVENKKFHEFSGWTSRELDDLFNRLMHREYLELNDFVPPKEAGYENAMSDNLFGHQGASNWSPDGINVAGRNKVDIPTVSSPGKTGAGHVFHPFPRGRRSKAPVKLTRISKVGASLLDVQFFLGYILDHLVLAAEYCLSDAYWGSQVFIHFSVIRGSSH